MTELYLKKVNFTECSFNKTNPRHVLPKIHLSLPNKFVNLSFHKNISYFNLQSHGLNFTLTPFLIQIPCHNLPPDKIWNPTPTMNIYVPACVCIHTQLLHYEGMYPSRLVFINSVNNMLSIIFHDKNLNQTASFLRHILSKILMGRKKTFIK